MVAIAASVCQYGKGHADWSSKPEPTLSFSR
jgi:hypothetical protein